MTDAFIDFDSEEHDGNTDRHSLTTTGADDRPAGATHRSSHAKRRPGAVRTRRASTAPPAAFFPLLLLVAPIAADRAASAQDPAAAPFVVRAGDPRVSDTARAAVLRLLPEALSRIAPQFPGTPTAPFEVIIHSNESSLSLDDARHLHPGTPGFALLGRNEIHILLDHVRPSPPDDLRTVLAHELTHVLVDQFAGEVAARVPRWLHEGLAQSLSGDTYLQAREISLVVPAQFDRLARLSTLVRDFPTDDFARRMAYHQSFSFVDWLIRRQGLGVILRGIRLANEQDGFFAGYALATGHPLGEDYDRWLHWITHESGAGWLFLFENCFSYSMILGIVLLALAGTRIWNREARMRAKLEHDEVTAEESAVGESAAENDGDPRPEDDT